MSSPGSPAKIELEPSEAGGLEYKIVLISKTSKYVVQYHADTLDKTYEKKIAFNSRGENQGARERSFDPSSLIGLDKAAGIARSKQAGTITKWKIEIKDSGLVQYEFDIRPKGASDDREIQVDAKNGSVRQDD